MIMVNSECTSCGACSSICPQRCISIANNEFGFSYPVVDISKCIDCDLCKRVCHLESQLTDHSNTQKAFSVASKFDDVIYRSTSGGAFSELARFVLKKHGSVYGCAYTENLKARHVRIDTINELYKLNGSKYVQSEIGDAFTLAKNDLKKGLIVLFSGTPCQIAALNCFLGKIPDNLITVDIVCHGVSSQTYFDKYIKWYQEKNSCTLNNYDFRSKSNSGWSLAGVCTGHYNRSGKPFRKRIYYYNEFYYFQFLKGLSYRDSCYSCRYANLERPGDITLGDMWGAEKLNLNFKTDKGCSLLIANTKKGLRILPELALDIAEIEIRQATLLNKQLVMPTKKPDNHNEFIKFISDSPACEIDRQFRENNKVERIKGFIKYHIPSWLKAAIKKKK